MYGKFIFPEIRFICKGRRHGIHALPHIVFGGIHQASIHIILPLGQPDPAISHLKIGLRISIRRHINFPLPLIVQIAVPGRVGLNHGTVTAEETVHFPCPVFSAGRLHGKEISKQAPSGAALPGHPLPIGLGHDAVSQIILHIMQIGRICGLPEQKVCQPDHIVYGAVLLVFVSQPGLQLFSGSPHLSLGLASGGKISSVRHRTFPITPDNIQPFFPAGHLIGSGTAQDLRYGGIGMHVREYVLALQQRLKQAPSVIPAQKLPVFLFAGNL